MINLAQYAGEWADTKDWDELGAYNAVKLLQAVNSLMETAEKDGVIFKVNPKTNSQVSGEQYGGFRPQSCPIGAPKSAHKVGMAVDIYDPDGHIDIWCLKNLSQLIQHGIYIEAPASTVGWSHWQTRPTINRVFIP